MATPMSPEWKKPSDIMKIHRKKKVVRPGYLGKNRDVQSPDVGHSGSEIKPRAKRKNPFGCSPRKKANTAIEEDKASDSSSLTEEEENRLPSEGVLFDVLNRKDKMLSGQDIKHKDSSPHILEETVQHQGTVKQADTTEATDAVHTVVDHPGYPQDWSLKMKARFISHTPFAWCCSLKTLDEAKGMERFIQHSPSTVKLDGKSPANCHIAKAEFHKCCLYWVHPNIPWLKLFPRMVTDNKIGKTSTILQDKEVLESIMNDWTESFTSAFHLLRAGTCKYLYMCCHQFTVVFFAANTRSDDGPMEAVVTPTSRGFREALKSEDIEFTLPLQPKTESGNSPKAMKDTKPTVMGTAARDSQGDLDQREDAGCDQEDDRVEKQAEDEDEDDLEQTDEGAASWLETLGLDKKRYRSLDPNKVKLQRDGFRLIDNRPESTVQVTGAHTQALFNYLLNCRSCVANTGTQAGIPPTLLCPIAFKGATLKTLKVKQGNLRQQNSEEAAYSLEVTGPILPSTYTGLNDLLTLTQKDYTATYSVHEPTAPFNVGVEASEESTDSDHLPYEKSMRIPLGKEAIRELNCESDKYNWTKY